MGDLATEDPQPARGLFPDRKSTRLNSSHLGISYAVFCLKKKTARQLAMDPVALRRSNLIADFPYRSGLGITIDSGRFTTNLDEVGRRVLTEAFAVRRRESAKRGQLRGLGIACFLETSRGTPGERAEIRFEPDSRVTLVLLTQSTTPGLETLSLHDALPI